MIRHISIFFLKEEGKTEHQKIFLERLTRMEPELGNIAGYTVGTDFMERPPKGEPNVPEFGDLVQVIDFVEEEDAFAYAGHAAHINLVTDMSMYLEKVVAIDIRL